ncbi:hypothetical protein [Xenorhabdus szentirmaii]|uniref:Uncharacterized protein n=1 Tax=Xenorhabdus szentirmaii DSM 16338 TaxID=1427518 RepID=W1J3D9_9GAMM|nr:hypothetical protein [Xenorhabdus szentirmaii]PHM30385.1 hypothetical protein Xsze_04225 [Xenorhabdus szentirmaii DSM 16338]CDL85234.1 conserved hypothetical protein [Xenorhabdus szentirmaii DSM 16338]
MRNNAQDTPKKRYYKLDELRALAEARGYALDFNAYLKVFELRDKQHPDNWCWIVRPENGVKVGRTRECPIPEWDDIMDFNINRLKARAENNIPLI